MSYLDFIKLPRLYVDQELQENALVSLKSDQAHYLVNVMRRKAGDALRLFNGRQGEWLAVLEQADKKTSAARVEKQLIPQPGADQQAHLLFTPIKKARMDFLIEKAVELGVTQFHPVLTAHTEVRQINEERVRQQIIEAAEQCERLSIPVLYPLEKLEKILTGWDETLPVYACIERREAPLLAEVAKAGPSAFLIGPEGGFSEEEKLYLESLDFVMPVSLGGTILRAETAALACLALHNFIK